MHCKKIVIDIETTGFPEKNGYMYYHPSHIEKYENSRIIEIAYSILDEENNVIRDYSQFIKYDKPIPNTAVHGITDDMIINGITFSEFAKIFEKDLKIAEVIVAHNLQFDYSVIVSELFRIARPDLIELITKKALYCTMINSMRYLNSGKFLKLIDVYNHVTGARANQSHRAHEDVSMCVVIFSKIVKTNRDLIKLRYFKL